MNMVRSKNMSAGYHFFDDATMKLFSSRIVGNDFNTENDVYFGTSERDTLGIAYGGKRMYTIRKFNKETARIETVGEFCAYDSLNKLNRALNELKKSLSK